MAQYGSNSITIQFADSGATLRDISNYVRTLNGMDIQAILVESHAFGDAWVESLFAGVRKMADVVYGGYYDDTVSVGPHDLMATTGVTRENKITWGGSKSTDFQAVIMGYKRLPVINDLTKFESTVRPTGAPTEV